MPPVRQEADDLIGRLLVVGGDGGQVVEPQGPGAAGQQQAGDADGLEPGLEQGQVAPQEHDAQGLPLPAELQGEGHLVGVLVQVVDGGVPPRVPEQGLDALHQVGEEHVLGALHQQGDAGARLLFEVLGVVVGLEAVFLHDLHDPAAGLLADVRVVVEHPGHGGDADAGQAGDILDGHERASSPGDGSETLPITFPENENIIPYLPEDARGFLWIFDFRGCDENQTARIVRNAKFYGRGGGRPRADLRAF